MRLRIEGDDYEVLAITEWTDIHRAPVLVLKSVETGQNYTYQDFGQLRSTNSEDLTN